MIDRDEVLRMARDAADPIFKADPLDKGGEFVTLTPKELERFAAFAHARGQQFMQQRAAQAALDAGASDAVVDAICALEEK